MERQLIKHVEETDSFVQYSRVLFRGAVVQESTYEIQRMWFYTPEKVQNVLSNCVRREGALGTEKIEGKLVPTCSFYNEDSQLVDKIGSVPFGQVRFQQYLEGEEFLDFHLVSFREGK